MRDLRRRSLRQQARPMTSFREPHSPTGLCAPPPADAPLDNCCSCRLSTGARVSTWPRTRARAHLLANVSIRLALRAGASARVRAIVGGVASGVVARAIGSSCARIYS